jgi:hypothetical protein
MLKLLSTIYPDFPWSLANFEHSQYNFRGDLQAQRRKLELAGESLNIKELSDWYPVTKWVIDNFSFF